MKANEAPEKLYVNFHFIETHPESHQPLVTKQGVNKYDIEYTRTDVSIEKAYKYFASCIPDNSGGYERAKVFENFKKYMKENNQWKPSMAQLNAFSVAIKQVDKGNADVLEGLYKKLVEL